jgi:hypothetical protein
MEEMHEQEWTNCTDALVHTQASLEGEEEGL